ncbi:alpha/beta fold hydrolase [Zooshikella harenae]|uniref:Alpha/beta fold hydrolase n=1 Tax=Zooshikella harenae TaxID=2827238 RepID=A0ABS5ZCW3_9GAMM|nr:alpha/beta fold hydrolase [Zooshikella harenae]MBU2711892.1 alpha/beta fold hydrolase [Zooshikella harenae]
MRESAAFPVKRVTAAFIILTVVIAFCFLFRDSLTILIYHNALTYTRDGAGVVVKHVTVKGHRVSYLEGGDPEGQSVVFVHGFAANKDVWLELIRLLPDRYHFFAIDLPGHGNTNWDLESYSIENQVAAFKHTVDALKLEKFHLVGNSMGGWISFIYAAEYSEQVLTLGLLNSAGIVVTDMPSEYEKLLKQGNNPLLVEKPGDMSAFFEFVMSRPPQIPSIIVHAMELEQIAHAELNRKIFKGLRSSAETFYQQQKAEEYLNQLKMPTLVLWGKDDRVLSEAIAPHFHRYLEDVSMIILPHIGHAPMIEAAHETAKELLTIWQRVPKQDDSL